MEGDHASKPHGVVFRHVVGFGSIVKHFDVDLEGALRFLFFRFHTSCNNWLSYDWDGRLRFLLFFKFNRLSHLEEGYLISLSNRMQRVILVEHHSIMRELLLVERNLFQKSNLRHQCRHLIRLFDFQVKHTVLSDDSHVDRCVGRDWRSLAIQTNATHINKLYSKKL